jgi:putative sigma-54 modulation protein
VNHKKGGIMNIKISSIHFDADKKLLDFINEKVSKLEIMHDGIIGSEVVLRIDNSADTENKLAEIKILIAGNDLFAKKQCKTFEEAIDTSVEAIRKQLQKHKDKVRGV